VPPQAQLLEKFCDPIGRGRAKTLDLMLLLWLDMVLWEPSRLREWSDTDAGIERNLDLGLDTIVDVVVPFLARKPSLEQRLLLGLVQLHMLLVVETIISSWSPIQLLWNPRDEVDLGAGAAQ
jgi:hypothetical protein